jgi:hypothetical protein
MILPENKVRAIFTPIPKAQRLRQLEDESAKLKAMRYAQETFGISQWHFAQRVFHLTRVCFLDSGQRNSSGVTCGIQHL